MGFLGKVFKSVVSTLSKVADIIAPICAFIPGLNPVVTMIAAGIKAVDGLTDKPPNFGKMFEGVLGMIPGGALAKVLGPFSKIGGTAGKFVEMFTGAIAGKGPGAGGLLGDVLQNVLGNSKIGGKGSLLGGLATTLFDNLADKVRSVTFQGAIEQLLLKNTGAQPTDNLTAQQIADALTQPTGRNIERLIDGRATMVPERIIHPELTALFQSLANQVVAEHGRASSTYNPAAQAPVQLSSAGQPVQASADPQLASDAQQQVRRNQPKS
jgi:hypothetical protein